jgi:DNA primase
VRLPGQSVIERIRGRISLSDFFTETTATSRDGRWRMAACPFHSDENPSFWIDVERGIGGCFAGCTRKPYDVIDLYARLTGITNGEAIRILARIV